MGTGAALVAEVVQQDVTEDATALTTVGADVWHRCLGHPAEQVMGRLQNISETGVKFDGSLSPCETCKINKSVQQDHPKTVESVISERLHLVSTDLTGPITPPAQGGYRLIAKFTDHFTTFKAVYFIKTKDDALTTLCRFIQDLAIPLGLRIHRLRSDRGGEYIADYCRSYCKTTGIRQEFTPPYTPQANGLSERDGRTILNVTRCLLNEANLPKTLWGEIAATAVFLINRLPHSSINGDTPYYRMSSSNRKCRFYGSSARELLCTRSVVSINWKKRLGKEY